MPLALSWTFFCAMKRNESREVFTAKKVESGDIKARGFTFHRVTKIPRVLSWMLVVFVRVYLGTLILN